MATKKSSSRDNGPQEIYVSRSEKKRLAKNIEEIAKELVELSPAHIKKLPADDLLKAELSNSRDLKGGALKRQTKFIAGLLRESGTDEILAFLAERKGSHLKQTGAFHELERLREDIITEVLAAPAQGELAPETKFILDKFGVAAPAVKTSFAGKKTRRSCAVAGTPRARAEFRSS